MGVAFITGAHALSRMMTGRILSTWWHGNDIGR